jgi:hypothetical protein
MQIIRECLEYTEFQKKSNAKPWKMLLHIYSYCGIIIILYDNHSERICICAQIVFYIRQALHERNILMNTGTLSRSGGISGYNPSGSSLS